MIAGQNLRPTIVEIPERESLPGEGLVIDLEELASDPDDSTGLRWVVEDVSGAAVARAIGTTLEVDLEPGAEGLVVVTLSVSDPFGATATGSLVINVILGRPGDFDRNGVINLNDFFLFGVAWGSQVGDEHYGEAFDLDGDGEVDFFDFLIWIPGFGDDFSVTSDQ